MKIGQEIYSKAQAAPDEGVKVTDNNEEKKNEDGSVDADVEENK